MTTNAMVVRRPPMRGGSFLRRLGDVAQFVAFAGLLIWALVQGARSMGYNWQWQRVPRYLWQVVDGEIYLGQLTKGLVVTLEISVLALVFTIAIGLVLAVLRRADSIAARAVSRAYVELIRNTPLLVQLYIFYFVVAQIFGLDRFWSGVLCLAAFEAAFAAEIFRAGIEAVPKGQWEAARSVGLSSPAMYRLVVLPQALRVVLPPLTGLAVSLIKHSAIVSAIAIFDLTTEGRNVIADTFLPFEIWITVAAMYIVVTGALSAGVSWLEGRLKT